MLLTSNVSILDLDKALACLQREDPSLKVRIDADTGQVRSAISLKAILFCVSLIVFNDNFSHCIRF